jgi:hypothetical protein
LPETFLDEHEIGITEERRKARGVETDGHAVREERLARALFRRGRILTLFLKPSSFVFLRGLPVNPRF